MVGWHHRLNVHEFEQALGVGDGQGSLVCCSPWGHKELDMTESDSTELNPLQYSWASLVVKMVKNLPAMQESWVPSLDWDGPLEESMATHSSILTWRINPTDREAWWVTVHGVAKSWTRLTKHTEE